MGNCFASLLVVGSSESRTGIFTASALVSPSYGSERYYDTGDSVFNESQHIALNSVLSEIKVRFVLSYNDCSFIWELYGGFSVDEISRPNNLAARYKTDEAYRELTLKNY